MNKEQVKNRLLDNKTLDIDAWNVDNAFDTPASQTADQRRRAEQDWNDYLKTRDYVDDEGNVRDSQTGRFKKVDLDPKNNDAYYDTLAERSVAETSRSGMRIAGLIELARDAYERGDETMLDSISDDINARVQEMSKKHNWSQETVNDHIDRIAGIIEGRSKRRATTENEVKSDKNTNTEDNSAKQESVEPEKKADKVGSGKQLEGDGSEKSEDSSDTGSANTAGGDGEKSDEKDSGFVPIEPIPSLNESETGEAEEGDKKSQGFVPIEPIPLNPEDSDPVRIDPIKIDGAETSDGEKSDKKGSGFVPIEPIPLINESETGEGEEDVLLARADAASSNYARLNAQGRVRLGIFRRNKYQSQLEEARKEWQRATRELVDDELRNLDLRDVPEDEREACLNSMRDKYNREHSKVLLRQVGYYEQAIAPKEGGRKKLKTIAAVAFAVGFVTKIATKFTMMRQGVDFQTADVVGNVAAASSGAVVGAVSDRENIRYRRIAEADQDDEGLVTVAERDLREDEERIRKGDGTLAGAGDTVESRTKQAQRENRKRALGNTGLGALFGLFGGLSSDMFRGEKGEQGEIGPEGPRGPQGAPGGSGDAIGGGAEGGSGTGSGGADSRDLGGIQGELGTEDLQEPKNNHLPKTGV